MLLINNNGVTDAGINLALEEYCLRNLDMANEYILFYINAPSVIVGKHQNPFREINYEYITEKNIKVARRISGGGAVYHDYGNLNFSFITDFEKQTLNYFKPLLQVIVDTLIRIGVAARITEKNNIVIDGKKIPGTSQYTNMKRMLSHGTLLFNSEIDALNSVLDSKLEILESRGVESTISEVTNISSHLSRPMSMEIFRDKLIAGVSDGLGKLNEYRLATEDWEAVSRLAEEKYKSWEWTFGQSPKFTAHHKFQLGSVKVDAHIAVMHGIIKNINPVDDSIDSPAIHKIITEFIGKRYGSEYTDEWIA